MKKTARITYLAFLLCLSSSAQWTDNGNNLTTTDNVALGISSAISKFHVAVHEDAIAWPVVVNNTQNSSVVSGYGIGIKLKHSWNHEGFKWGGIASVQEGPWANHTGLALYADEKEYMRIRSNGNVGIGTTNPDMKLTVKGNIHAEEVKIDLNIPAPDYVFKEDYKLRTIEEVEQFIMENHHLPEIPSAREFEENGIMQAEMDMNLLKKIEELTLYTIRQEKEIEHLKKENEKIKSLDKELFELRSRLEKLESEK